MKKILIVDDIPEYVDTIETYLEDRFEVIKAWDRAQAETVYRKNKISLAIIDIRLDENAPDNKDGLFLLKLIRETTPEVGIIVMSAYREFDYAVEALNKGADYFMRKPIDPEKLNSVVDKILTGSMNQ